MIAVDVVLSALVSGILFGGVYGLIALGLNFVYGVMKIVNIFHGDMIMLGAYMAFWLQRLWGLDPFLMMPAIFLTFYILGSGLFRIFVNPVYTNPKISPALVGGLIVVLTLGLSLIFESLALTFWTGDLRVITTAFTGQSLIIGEFILPYERVTSFIVAAGLTVLVFLFTKRTDLGRGIMATIQDPEAAQLVGFKRDQINNLTFSLSVALAAVAGPLVALFFPLTPYLGFNILTKAFAIVILGGFGNPHVSLYSGIVLGVTESIFSLFFPLTYTAALFFFIIIAVLLIKPSGLFGTISR